MTMEERIVLIASIQASRTLAQTSVWNGTDQAQWDYFVLNPVFCTGVAGLIHHAYHVARAQMRRKAQKRHGRLSRPQKREWNEIQKEFQWLYDHALISFPGIERNGLTCFGCDSCAECQLAKYYDKWVDACNGN